MPMISSPVTLPTVHPFVGMNVPSLLGQRSASLGDAAFLIWEPGPPLQRATWTYAEFATDVDRVAAGLTARGVSRGDPVVLLLDNCPAFLFCWFACARVGAIAVDLNTRYTTDELAHAIAVVGGVGIVTHRRHLEVIDPLIAPERWVEFVDDETGTCPALFGSPTLLTSGSVDPAAPLCVQFTSGTTARPKAVLYTHANALWAGRVGATHARFSADDVTLIYAPLFHTMALCWQLLATLWAGGAIVLVPKFSASRFWDVSVRHRCTSTTLIGVMIKTLLEQPVPEHHYRLWHFGLEMPQLEAHFQVRLLGCWGMSEVVTNVIVGDLDRLEEPGSIGRPSPEYSVRVTKPDGEVAEVGDVGELRIGGVRGLSLFAGYVGDAAATAESFDEDGYFRTGDAVELLDSGPVRFALRLKDMLKVGGENVACAEIERVLQAHPSVNAVAVIGRPDPLLDEVPVAFVVSQDRNPDQMSLCSTLQETCRRTLADFKVPRAIYVVDELPEAALGKIAKGTLSEMAETMDRQ
jgi:carnitine-CoA ligase